MSISAGTLAFATLTLLRARSLVVECGLQHGAGFERQHAAGIDGDLHAGLRVATGARLLLSHDEVAEAGDLDLLAGLERALHDVEDLLDEVRCFLLGESTDALANAVDDVGFGHRDHPML